MSAPTAYAIAQQNAPHETVCGDGAIVIQHEVHTLIAVVDGLGHGPGAHAATSRALSVVSANASLPPEPLMRLLDRELASTRGAAVSLAQLTARAPHRLLFAGIGNVECRVRTAGVAPQPIPLPGIVGRGLRKVRVWEYPVAAGDLVVLFTDGLSQRLVLEADVAPAALVAAMLARYAKGSDDALIVALRVGG